MSATPAAREVPYLRFEPSPKRLRVVFAGETVADSTGVQLLYEGRYIPVYYFPKADVRADLLTPSDHSTHCPHKGDASYAHVSAGGRQAENAVWWYPDPLPQAAFMDGYMAFYWDRMDQWLEEDEEVFVHARDPLVRLDILESSRPVKVVLGGEVVAETSRARFLMETGLPTRYYIPAEDIRQDLLTPSETRSACPYKGTAHYHTAQIGDQVFTDIVWHYPDPLPESEKVRGYHCFFNEKVDAILVDGEEQPRPKTKWS